ncbi:hypothetical protein ACFSKU_13235 [Pontibacter silvestris]|uniref:Glycosyl hydrolase family 65 n=1 Tax=Pontibacter silvestris TaxID=2305183 RepID=A0ABW4WZ40_9BACT|nr:hypothetical protein [Pontibacter silvestris]MCC9135588.1 hypothetical protein [Pontibacter silvestris]
MNNFKFVVSAPGKCMTAFALLLLLGCSATDSTIGTLPEKIDRYGLVTRHNITLTEPDTLASLSVGNGDFAYTVDISGLQSYPEYYENGVSLGTQSQWGWHSVPTDQNYTLEDVARYDTAANGRVIPFPVQHKGSGRMVDAMNWLRTNPHRLHLGVIGLVLLKENGEQAEIQELQKVDQKLDLWTGKIKSKYEVEGTPVMVELYSHQGEDAIAARITSPLISKQRLKVSLKFPYGADCHVCPGYNWDDQDKHTTTLARSESGVNQVQLKRQLDTTVYYTNVRWNEKGEFTEKEKHHYELIPSADQESLEFTVLFSQNQTNRIPDYEATEANSEANWKNFWTKGGAIDFSGSTDPRASELERRVVLSQYLTKIQCTGDLPPQETGLTMNSWYGKPHLEMHWWHGVHFALWNRLDLLEKSLPWYKKVMSKARATAKWQGYEGVRWQKMTDPYGNESPSSIGPYLIWQQPHIIYFSELVYRQHPNKETLEKYKDLVFETANFMASFPTYNQQDQKYHLASPLIPAQELFPAKETNDPPFELAYWHYALSVAQEWRLRLGLPEDEKWQAIINQLAPLAIKDGLYLPSATHPQAYEDDFYRRDHPVVLGAYGYLPLSEKIDTAIMMNTYKEILSKWQWETTWGWDYPMMAMSAAKLGAPEKAVDALFLDAQKNTYLPNGHNYQDKRLRIYLPGNGGLLTAVAMMAAGWDGAPDKPAPGFPDNGKWKVKWEGLHKMP